MSPRALSPFPLAPASPLSQVARGTAAAVLRRASRWLSRLARRIAAADAPSPSAPPQLEFHAEAGAPEGALYADGVLVALLPGVTRL
jgi:hypothetical protein